MDEIKVFLATEEKQDQMLTKQDQTIQKQTEVKGDTASLITKINALQQKVDSMVANPVTSFDYRNYNHLIKFGRHINTRADNTEVFVPSIVNELDQSVAVSNGNIVNISGEGFIESISLGAYSTTGGTVFLKFRIFVDGTLMFHIYMNANNGTTLIATNQYMRDYNNNIIVQFGDNSGSANAPYISALNNARVFTSAIGYHSGKYHLLPFPIFFKVNFTIEATIQYPNAGMRFAVFGGTKK